MCCITYLSSATFDNSSGLNESINDEQERTQVGTYLFKIPSTEERIAGNVVARLFREETNARTVLIAWKATMSARR